MLNYSPCMDIFFPDFPFEKRISIIAGLGYKQFEFWTWWDKDIDSIRNTIEKHDLKVAGFCTHFISLVDPTARNEYLEGLKKTIETAKKLNSSIIISQVGNEVPGVSREKQRQSMIDGLKASAELMEKTDQVLAIEPLNLLYDHAGYYLSTSQEAAIIIDAVGSEKVKILFDIYHQQITEGDIINNIKKYYDKIAHFHVADNPGRHEIGTGEINYPVVLKEIEKLGYEGNIGIELFPINENHDEVLSNKLFFS
jgi:hydroxypyruvate isomerase